MTMNNNIRTHDLQFNISTSEHMPAQGPDLHVVVIIGLILVILVAVAAMLLFKYVSRLARSQRQQQAEETMARAIHIYNSQEPLEEPDLVYLRPGDTSRLHSSKDHRGNSEIAFVHSDGRIERFRPLTNNNSRGLLPAREQYSRRSEAPQKSHPAYHSNDPEAYTVFQPLCVTLDSASTLSVDADLRDTISLGGCDIPPSYEEALNMPLANSINTHANRSSRDDAMERRLDYCNIEIGQPNSETKT